MQAHRDHVYQQLVRVWGGSHTRVAALATAGAAALAAVAWLPLPLAASLVAAVVVGYLALPRALTAVTVGAEAGARDA
jgi:hypothetical protein